MMFVGLGLSGVIPVCQSVLIYGYSDLNRRMGLNWVLFQGFLYIFGAFLYAVSNYSSSLICPKSSEVNIPLVQMAGAKCTWIF